MAMMSIPDKTGPDLALVPDATEQTSTFFPFDCVPANGYRELTPALNSTTGQKTCLDVQFAYPITAQVGNDQSWYSVLLWMPSPAIIVTPRSVRYFPDGFGTPETVVTSDFDFSSQDGGGNYLHPDKVYTFEFCAVDANTFTVRVFDDSRKNITTGTVGDTGMFAGEATAYYGWPTDALLANDTGDNLYTYNPFGITVVGVHQLTSVTITDIVFVPKHTPMLAAKTKANGLIGRFKVVTDTYVPGLTFFMDLVSGTGDDDNALFVNPYDNKGDELRSVAALTAGAKLFRVEAYSTGDFLEKVQKALSVTIS